MRKSVWRPISPSRTALRDLCRMHYWHCNFYNIQHICQVIFARRQMRVHTKLIFKHVSRAVSSFYYKLASFFFEELLDGIRIYRFTRLFYKKSYPVAPILTYKDIYTNAYLGLLIYPRLTFVNKRFYIIYEPSLMLFWLLGMRYGAYLKTRADYSFRAKKDSKRRKKVKKDLKKKKKKLLHSIEENKRLIRGKRRKPKKIHRVYYK